MIERIAGGARFVAAVAADVVGRAVEAADIVALLFLHMRTASVVLVEETTLPVSGNRLSSCCIYNAIFCIVSSREERQVFDWTSVHTSLVVLKTVAADVDVERVLDIGHCCPPASPPSLENCIALIFGGVIAVCTGNRGSLMQT